jgi:hypothetical protein
MMQVQTREDFMTTLGLAAMIHGTNKAVCETATRLAKRAPGAVRKNTLLPLSQSSSAYDIIVETVVHAKEERILGKVWRDGYEYEIAVQMEPDYEYCVEEVFDLTLECFIKRGIVTGSLLISVISPESGLNVTREISMDGVVGRMAKR